jgi:hypothetical protein
MKKLSILLICFLTMGGIAVQAQTKPADSTKRPHTTSSKILPATTTPAPSKVPAQAASTTNKSGDKVVGTDAKGRTIYEGPRGGRYVLTAKGNKEYLKKTN